MSVSAAATRGGAASAAARAALACRQNCAYTRPADILEKSDRKTLGRAGKLSTGCGEKLLPQRPIFGVSKSPRNRQAQGAGRASITKTSNWNAPFLSFLDQLDESQRGLVSEAEER